MTFVKKLFSTICRLISIIWNRRDTKEKQMLRLLKIRDDAQRILRIYINAHEDDLLLPAMNFEIFYPKAMAMIRSDYAEYRNHFCDMQMTANEENYRILIERINQIFEIKGNK